MNNHFLVKTVWLALSFKWVYIFQIARCKRRSSQIDSGMFDNDNHIAIGKKRFFANLACLFQYKVVVTLQMINTCETST